jgi:hypothetical protein
VIAAKNGREDGPTEMPEWVYNWEIEDYHTYFDNDNEDAPSNWATILAKRLVFQQ